MKDLNSNTSQGNFFLQFSFLCLSLPFFFFFSFFSSSKLKFWKKIVLKKLAIFLWWFIVLFGFKCSFLNDNRDYH